MGILPQKFSMEFNTEGGLQNINTSVNAENWCKQWANFPLSEETIFVSKKQLWL